jgi:arylsulfatase A-like enzyme
MPENARPNILLIHSDQHRYDSVGVNGHRIVRTPTLDRLAREGVNFSHAFTPCPICSPARGSLLTGAWPTAHGCLCIPHTEHFRPMHPQFATWSQLLRDAGYWLGYVGKFHNEVAGGPTDIGFDEYSGTWPYKKWRAEQGLPPEPKEHGLFGDVDHACPPEKSCLAWQADHVLRTLDHARASGQPWVMRWDPPEPHLPCRPPQQFADMYPPAAIPPWPSWPDPLEHKPEAQRRQWRIWGLENWPWEKWQPVVSRYFAIITEMDYHLGRILAALDQHGTLDNTLIIYTTDHGDFCGGHGLIDKHFSMYDDLVRVPLLLRWPGHVPAGVTCDRFVSHELDIAQTLLAAAGVTAPDTFHGCNLLDAARGHGPSRPDIFAQYFGTASGMYSQRMLRDRRFKYVYNPTAFDELYDLEHDPGEIRNLIDDAALQPELARLRQRLAAWMEEIHDPLYNGWTQTELTGAPNQAQLAGLA